MFSEDQDSKPRKSGPKKVRPDGASRTPRASGGSDAPRSSDSNAPSRSSDSRAPSRSSSPTRPALAPKSRASGPLGPSAMPSDRPVQIAGEIRRALQAEIARGINDPRVQGMVSITEVLLTPDLSTARVKVSVLPEARASLTLSGLRAASGFLRRRVMDETRLGRVPRIEFDLDDTLKRQASLDVVLRDGIKPADSEDSAEGNPESQTR